MQIDKAIRDYNLSHTYKVEFKTPQNRRFGSLHLQKPEDFSLYFIRNNSCIASWVCLTPSVRQAQLAIRLVPLTKYNEKSSGSWRCQGPNCQSEKYKLHHLCMTEVRILYNSISLQRYIIHHSLSYNLISSYYYSSSITSLGLLLLDFLHLVFNYRISWNGHLSSVFLSVFP